jgi:hypothetical protein
VQAGRLHERVHAARRLGDAAPPANRLEIVQIQSDIRPELKKGGVYDDKCVARWDEVG